MRFTREFQRSNRSMYIDILFNSTDGALVRKGLSSAWMRPGSMGGIVVEVQPPVAGLQSSAEQVAVRTGKTWGARGQMERFPTFRFLTDRPARNFAIRRGARAVHATPSRRTPRSPRKSVPDSRQPDLNFGAQKKGWLKKQETSCHHVAPLYTLRSHIALMRDELRQGRSPSERRNRHERGPGRAA